MAPMFRFFKSEFFHFEALRLLSFTPHEGGEVAEFLEAVAKIRDLDIESWYATWIEASQKAAALATEAEQVGNRGATRRALLRAANYQRAAQFMLNGRADDPRILKDSEAAIATFWRAVNLFDDHLVGGVTRLEIPYEDGVTLPGYLYLPHPARRVALPGGKMPLLVNTVGGDATQEEIFHIFPMAGLELGYAVLTFEGPGQGIVLRRHGLPMRPDWEVVVGKVLDFGFAHIKAHEELRASIDLEKTVIAGSSVGGYLSLRGASDPRIRACVSGDPFYCMFDLLQGRMPAWLINAFSAGGFGRDAVWDGIATAIKALPGSLQTRWESDLTCWFLGVPKTGGIADMFRAMMTFTFGTEDAAGFLSRVRCPVLVTGARYGLYSSPEISTDRIYDELVNVPADKKEKWIAETPGEGGLQSKVGAFQILTTKSFAFFDKSLGIDRRL